MTKAASEKSMVLSGDIRKNVGVGKQISQGFPEEETTEIKSKK